MLYDHPIGQLNVKQTHDSFLTVLVITGVPSCRDQTYSVGLHKLTPQHIIAIELDCQRLEKHLDITDL